jgi:mannose-6-phosphate isomerase-like protein (cupin superfamily)
MSGDDTVIGLDRLVVGMTLGPDDFAALLHPVATRLHLGRATGPTVAAGPAVASLLYQLLHLEDPQWTGFRVRSLDAGERLATFDVCGTDPDPRAVTASVRAWTAADGRGLEELMMFVPFASSLEPVGVRERVVVGRDDIDGISLLSLDDRNRVVKHWGSEHWLHATGDDYSFKVVKIRAGTRTSLQYHREKHETYFILSGHAVLHCRDRTGASRIVDFPAGYAARVLPGAVHRVEGLTDVVLIEASTADDGSDNVRIDDDFGRADGRIDAEYATFGADEVEPR